MTHSTHFNLLIFAGPSVLEVFNNLLRHLRISLDRKSENQERRTAEKIFEEAIINTIGQ